MSRFSWLFSPTLVLSCLPSSLKEPIFNPLSLSYSHPSLNYRYICFVFISSFSFLLLSLINYVYLHIQPSCSSFLFFPPPPHSLHLPPRPPLPHLISYLSRRQSFLSFKFSPRDTPQPLQVFSHKISEWQQTSSSRQSHYTLGFEPIPKEGDVLGVKHAASADPRLPNFGSCTEVAGYPSHGLAGSS